MRIEFHKKYIKQWSKLTLGQQLRVERATKLFIKNRSSSQLRFHQLKGDYYPQYSISAGGDLRVHLIIIDANLALFLSVGTHAQLYR